MRRTAALLIVAALTAAAGTTPATSAAPKHRAAYTVTATASASTVVIGKTVKFTGSVSPAAVGEKVALQVRASKSKPWETTGVAKIASGGSYTVSDRPEVTKKLTYRVVKPASDGHTAGVSASMTVTVYQWHYLTDLDYGAGRDVGEYDTVTINGNIYKKSLRATSGSYPGFLEYDVRRRCTTLTGVVGLSDFSSSDGSGEIELLADGNSIYDHTFTFGTDESVSLDISNALRLRFEFTPLVHNAYGAWGKPRILCAF